MVNIMVHEANEIHTRTGNYITYRMFFEQFWKARRRRTLNPAVVNPEERGCSQSPFFGSPNDCGTINCLVSGDNSCMGKERKSPPGVDSLSLL
jgi:hypothetical protein